MPTEYWQKILDNTKAKKDKRKENYAKRLAKKWRKKHKTVKPQKSEETITSSRRSKWYRAWRRLVIKQQGYICNRCGSLENLHVHHKKLYAKDMKERLKLNNGEVLCFDCHDAEHGGYISRKYGKT